MKTVKRWDCGCWECGGNLDVVDGGVWVSYTDYAKLEKLANDMVTSKGRFDTNKAYYALAEYLGVEL